MSKCSRCGEEIAEGRPCKACGIEIQYKDFKGSEMLDIKMPAPASKSGSRFGKTATSARKKGNNITRIAPKAKRPALSKPAFFLLAAVIIILSSVAWYYVLKFLLKY